MIELVVAIAGIGVAALFIGQFSQIFLQASRLVSERSQAAFLMQEGVEGVRYLRDASWSAHIAPLATGTPYYLSFTASTSAYTMTTSGQGLIEGRFARTIVFDNVGRDSNDDIIISGGTVDTSTKRVAVDLSWRHNGVTTTESVIFYIADIF